MVEDYQGLVDTVPPDERCHRALLDADILPGLLSLDEQQAGLQNTTPRDAHRQRRLQDEATSLVEASASERGTRVPSTAVLVLWRVVAVACQ